MSILLRRYVSTTFKINNNIPKNDKNLHIILCRDVCRKLGEIKDIVAPAFAESVSEGDVRWETKLGNQVKEDDVLCEIETDKVHVS
jgi:hypothetical protein